MSSLGCISICMQWQCISPDTMITINAPQTNIISHNHAKLTPIKTTLNAKPRYHRQAARTSMCPSSSMTFPRSHSRPSPLFDHRTLSGVPSPSISANAALLFHRLMVASSIPAARSLSSFFCLQFTRSRSASRAMSQSSSSVVSPVTGRRVDRLAAKCSSSSGWTSSVGS